MVIKFLHPVFLLFAPVCIAFLAFVYIKYTRRSFESLFYTIVRTIVVLCLILSVSGTMIFNYSSAATHIYLIDMSASMEGNMPEILDGIKAAGETRSDKDSVGVVCFGESAFVDSMPNIGNNPAEIRTVVDRSYSNIAEGLSVAQSIITEGTKKHIILVSDGVENIGDAVTQAKLIHDNGKGAAISVMPFQNGVTKEVQLTEIHVPKYLKKDSKYDVEITAHSLSQTSGRLVVYKNNQIISDTLVTLRAGENKYVFTDVCDKSGGVIFRAEMLPEDDTFIENNKVFGFSHVEGAAAILLIDNDGGGAQLQSLLESANVDVAHVTARSAPTSAEQLALYDGIILANTPIDALPQNFPELLDHYVKNSGGGVFVTGGDQSYALGDYKDMPLEALLPVNMELKDKDKMPTLGMMVVLDRSGSMGVGRFGVSKLELAKEAVIRSLSMLNDQDSLGVIMFDDGYQWASEFQLVGENRGGIENDIAGIQLGGGTSILPGLTAAYNAISAADTKVKHIILLTDGQAEQSGFQGLISQMNAEGITLSCVAVGEDSDIKLLKRLANDGGGRYYYSDEFSDLPKVFARETSLAGKTFLNNRVFSPVVTASSPMLNGVERMPDLSGYVSTTGKDRADIILESDKQDPVLAFWQYGLGRSAAWTSDAAGMWTAGWLSSAEGAQIFKNAVSWTMRKQIATEAQITAEVAADYTKLRVTIPYSEGVLSVNATVVAPDMSEHKVGFYLKAPGEFEGVLNMKDEGAYIANLEIEKLEGTEQILSGVSIPYSKEFDIRYFGSGEALLNKIAETSGGAVILDPKSVYTTKLNDVFGQKDISNILLAIAIILFLFDIFIRRFPFAVRFAEKTALKIKTALSKPKVKKRAIVKPAAEKAMSAKPVPDSAEKTQAPQADKAKASLSGALVSGKKKRVK